MELKLCKDLHDLLVERQNEVQFKIVQIIPSIEEYENRGPFIVHTSSLDTLDIGMTKKTYLQIFIEAHTYWHHVILPKKLHSEGKLKDLLTSELYDIYFSTLGYLVTTNENHTIVRLHELCLLELEEKRDVPILELELKFLTCLVNSKLKRINKSATIWFLIKKIALRLIFSDLTNTQTQYKMLVDRTFKSIELHFANYYASSFLKWLIRYNYLSSGQVHILQDIQNRILGLLIEEAHSKLSDFSLWSSFETYLRVHGGVEDDNAYTYLQEEVSFITQRDLRWVPRQPDDIHLLLVLIDEQISWLIRIECAVVTPFKSLMNPLVNMSISDSKKQLVMGKVREYQKTIDMRITRLKDSGCSDPSLLLTKETFSKHLKDLC
ncbi:hypothetical protein HYPBUDRAFT_151641 [Hyphopichia burtonii NRRL Y-1933]|uniref:Uncharacterized protein n=1 Tax=Hyphopichia burtonii NRRL Y-1933 TaxID=984485 RepID=A0A1E4RSG8_9ASCO|nr:hypothetical protein HYPBUDRAFT_151641 [Hyphopichia burtonii NRRL Y-1933]ODV70232.1 hypothetical protein HYPBUDRAFT_151641 [Hyphopichia burtonii NRRL Y-1933]